MKMSKRSERLRALVTERLTAAAEEIFALVERTIAEYEEELCGFKEENQRKQQILDSLDTTRKDVHIPAMTENSTSTSERDEPLSCKLESISDLCVKHEDDEEQSSPFQTEQQQEILKDEEQPDFIRFKAVEQINISSDSEGDWDSATGNSAQTENHGEHHIAMETCEETPLNVGFFDDDTAQIHECLACGESFAESEELHSHMASHVAAKPFSCPVCGKEFTRKNDFNLHLTVHTGAAPFACPECEARFALKSHLDSHLKGHRAAPLCCPVCNKSFTRKYRLHSHMAAHTGERPFVCPVCGRGFTRKDNLGTHMATHNGKPFICSVCNRCFVRKDRLTAHMASHATVAPLTTTHGTAHTNMGSIAHTANAHISSHGTRTLIGESYCINK